MKGLPMSALQTIKIIYDGECPVCKNYVTMLRLKESVGEVELIDAREDIHLAEQFLEEGYNLDNGMIVIYQQQIFYGQKAVHVMALLSTNVGAFNKMNVCLFKNEMVAKIAYPILVFLRKILLKILGKTTIFKH